MNIELLLPYKGFMNKHFLSTYKSAFSRNGEKCEGIKKRSISILKGSLLASVFSLNCVWGDVVADHAGALAVTNNAIPPAGVIIPPAALGVGGALANSFAAYVNGLIALAPASSRCSA
jgi:hypothetical protein